MTNANDPFDALIDLKASLARIRTFELTEEEARTAREQLGEYRWASIQRHYRRERAKARTKEDSREVDRWRRRASDDLVNPFLAKHFEGATAREQTRIREQIQREAQWDDAYHEYPVFEMARDGLRKMRRKRRLRHFVHTWEAVKGLLAIALVLAIYSRLDTPFEVIAASLLILLYTATMRSSWAHGIIAGVNNQAAYVRYIELRKALGFEPNDEEMETVWNFENQTDKARIRQLVADVGYSLVNLIAFINLLRAALLY